MNVSNNRYIDVIDGSIALTLFDFTIICWIAMQYVFLKYDGNTMLFKPNW